MKLRLIWVVFAIFGILLFCSMTFVFFYWDDFGYASLSYIYNEPDVAGQNFTFAQLINYLGQMYIGWSGRVVYTGLMIVMLKNIWVYRIAQSIAVLIIFIALHRLAAKEKCNAVTALFCCSLYGAFSAEMFYEGFYWFSASATYILPLVFFFIGCLLVRYMDSGEPKNRKALILLGGGAFFLAGLSQEQTAFTLGAFLALLIVFDYLQNKKIRRHYLLFLLMAVLGSAFLLLAPGNFNRMEWGDSDDTIPDRILGRSRAYTNMVYLALYYIELKNIIFLLLLLFFVCYISYVLWKSGQLNSILYLFSLAAALFLLLLSYLWNSGRLATTIINSWDKFLLAVYVPLLFFVGLILKYLYFIKERYLAAFFLGALFSQITVLFYAPYFVGRMIIIFYFAMFALFIRAFADWQAKVPKKKLQLCVLLPLIVVSSFHLWSITRDYILEREVQIYNDRLLRQTAESIRGGTDLEYVEIIEVSPLINSNYEFYLWCMQEFYDIPHDVELRNY
jgi:hypothetical protein